MKLNAICIIKNEADIILETLDIDLRFCDTIYVFDNGSTDGSWEMILGKAQDDERIIIAAHTDEIDRNQFRNRVYNMFHHRYSASDWWYILDADDWLKRSENCFYYQEGEKMAFPVMDRVTYYASQARYWLMWRAKNFLSLKTTLLNKVASSLLMGMLGQRKLPFLSSSIFVVY
jgi:glycosyltransferase involved in cell wall biosynthesis